MRIALAQLYPKLGDLSANLQTHLDLMHQAAAQGAELVVFPELSLTGYYLRDLIVEVATPTDGAVFQQLCATSRELKLDMMVGFVEPDRRGQFYIAAAYISLGEIQHVHRKVYLPTYAMFDDARFFAYGDQLRAFDTRFGRIGMLICEDFWHISTSYVLWADGADLLLLHSASPGRGLSQGPELETSRWVNRLLETMGALYTVPVVHCNRVGFEDGQIFWGGSSMVDSDGHWLLQGPTFDEALLIQDLDLQQTQRSRRQAMLLRDERTDLTLRELQRIMAADPQKSFGPLPPKP